MMSSDQDVIPSESGVTDEFWSPSPSSSDVSSDTESERGTPVPPTYRTPSPPPPARASPRPIWINEHQKLQALKVKVKTGNQRLKVRQRIHEETKR